VVPDQQVLDGRERLDALSKAPDKVFRFKTRSLAGDCLHEAEQILEAMVGLTHEEANLLLVSFSLGHILGHANKQALSIRLSSQGERQQSSKGARDLLWDHRSPPPHPPEA